MQPLATAPLEKQASGYDWTGAARIAANCTAFQPDEEDEQVADEAISCYNCRYRRWTIAAFTCCKEKLLTV